MWPTAGFFPRKKFFFNVTFNLKIKFSECFFFLTQNKPKSCVLLHFSDMKDFSCGFVSQSNSLMFLFIICLFFVFFFFLSYSCEEKLEKFQLFVSKVPTFPKKRILKQLSKKNSFSPSVFVFFFMSS